MEISNRVAYSEALVRDFESLSSDGWRRLRAHKLSQRFLQEYLAAKCVTDFWCFIQYGVYTTTMKHFYEPLHGRNGLAGYLQDWTRLDEATGVRKNVNVKFVVWAREHVKTQTTIAWDCWQYARDPNNTLLLRAYTKPKAIQILGGVRELLESDQYRRNFPWVKPKCKRGTTKPFLWQNDQFMLERDDHGKRVPSAEAVGMGVDPTGGHFSLCHYDDFEVKENAESEVLLRELHDTWKNDSNLRLAGNKTVVCGTTWSRKGIIFSVVKRAGDYQNHEFDYSYQPVYVRVFPHPFAGEAATVLDDRLTVRVDGGNFPTAEANLNLCQATLNFFSPAVNDTVDEVREVVWNDGTHFRVNRPFAEMLGQPLTWKVGGEKPAAPNRFTMDSQDIHPPEGETEILARHSIPKKRLEQGSLVYAAQMDLDPSDPANMVLNPEFLQIKTVTPESGVPIWSYLPDGPKRWYRTCDWASDLEGTASTAIMEGFRHEQGLFITHITHERKMNDTDKLLELFLGNRRVERMNGRFEWTSFEKAAIENTLGGFLRQAEIDPYTFFSQFGGKYLAIADKEFGDKKSVQVPRKILPRPSNLSKNARISQQQPMLESRQIHVIVGPGFVSVKTLEALREEMRYFRLDGGDSYDLLDVMHDLVSFTNPPAKESETRRATNQFEELNRAARLRNSIAVVGASMVWPHN